MRLWVVEPGALTSRPLLDDPVHKKEWRNDFACRESVDLMPDEECEPPPDEDEFLLKLSRALGDEGTEGPERLELETAASGNSSVVACCAELRRLPSESVAPGRLKLG